MAMHQSLPIIVEVAIPLPLDKSFHYLVPASLAERAQPGRRVQVSLGNRKLTGYLLAFA